MRLIPLHDRSGSVIAVARVDEADFEGLSRHRWSVQQSSDTRRYVVRGTAAGKFLMHRQLLGLDADDPREVDHINRDGLDNRRSNLRFCTRAENSQNQGARSFGASRYRGVFWKKERSKWGARVKINYREHHLGYFDDEDEAGRVAAAFRAEHMPFSEDARQAA